MAERRTKQVKRVLVAAGVLLGLILLLDVSFRIVDARSKFASLRNLQSVQAALADSSQQLELGTNWRDELVRTGAIDEGQLRDPRSGQPVTFVERADLPNDADWSEAVLAFTPISDSKFAWWFSAYGRNTKGGGVLYGDGHAMWHAEPDFRRIIASVENFR